MIKDQSPLDEDEEKRSHDLDSLVTNIPNKETIEYIIHPIYTMKKIPQIHLTLKCILPLNLSWNDCDWQRNVSQFNMKLFKQMEGITMGGVLLLFLANIHSLNRKQCCYTILTFVS